MAPRTVAAESGGEENGRTTERRATRRRQSDYASQTYTILETILSREGFLAFLVCVLLGFIGYDQFVTRPEGIAKLTAEIKDLGRTVVERLDKFEHYSTRELDRAGASFQQAADKISMAAERWIDETRRINIESKRATGNRAPAAPGQSGS